MFLAVGFVPTLVALEMVYRMSRAIGKRGEIPSLAQHNKLKMLSIDEQTYSRLVSIMNDMMHTERRNISYDDVINELIDMYQDRLALSGENAGG